MTNKEQQINFWPQFSDAQHIKRTELSISARRFIKYKEKYLGRVCRRIWLYEDRLGENYIFGKFCKNREGTIVTISSYVPCVGRPKIKTFRWPDGNHYYVTVNGQDVVWNNKVKWNSEQEAVDAAEKYIKKNNL